MDNWLNRINGDYGSNTVRANQGIRTFLSPPISATEMAVKSNASSEDDFQEIDFTDDFDINNGDLSVDNLGYANYTYSELETMYGNKQIDVNEAEVTLSDLQDNSKNGILEAEQILEEAIKNDTSVGEELRNDYANCLKEISTKEAEISKKDAEITKINGEISDNKINISHLEAQMSKLQALQSSLPSYRTSQDDDEWNLLLEKRRLFESQILTVERNLENAKNKETALNEKLDSANKEKTTLNDELDTLNEQKNEKYGNEEEFMKNFSQATQDLKANLDTLKATVEKNKSDAQENLNTLRGELETISNYMNNHASLKVDDVEATTVADVASDVLGDNEYLEWQQVIDKIAKSGFDGQDLPKGEWCAGYVTYALSEYYGGVENIPANFKEGVQHKTCCWDYGQWARDNGILMDEREDSENYDVSQVQPGDLILFNKRDPNGNNIDSWRHIGIVTGISEDGSIAYTIEGNTSTTDNSYTQGNYYGDGGVLANKARPIDGSDFGESLGTSFILLHKLSVSDK